MSDDPYGSPTALTRSRCGRRDDLADAPGGRPGAGARRMRHQQAERRHLADRGGRVGPGRARGPITPGQLAKVRTRAAALDDPHPRAAGGTAATAPGGRSAGRPAGRGVGHRRRASSSSERSRANSAPRGWPPTSTPSSTRPTRPVAAAGLAGPDAIRRTSAMRLAMTTGPVRRTQGRARRRVAQVRRSPRYGSATTGCSSPARWSPTPAPGCSASPRTGWSCSITNSPLAVGITTALQFLPMLLFGLWGGLIADRYPKRRLLLITQTAMGAARRACWRC